MKEQVKTLLRELFARDLDDDMAGPSTGSRENLIDEYAERILKLSRETENGQSYRDASTGRFVTKDQAAASPATTILQKFKRFVKG